MAEETGVDGKAAYVAWATFISTIERFAKGVLPNRIDRSLFKTQSGTMQYQIIAALKSLGLVLENDEPSDLFKRLAVPDEGERKKVLREVVDLAYADLFALDLLKATPAQLDEQVTKSYGVTGSTRVKAVRFFLAATSYLGISVAPHFSAKGSTPGSSSSPAALRKRRRKKAEDPIVNHQPPATDPTPTDSNTKTVALRSGGSVTLTVKYNPFTVSDEDQAFVTKLIQEIRSYDASGESDDDKEDEA